MEAPSVAEEGPPFQASAIEYQLGRIPHSSGGGARPGQPYDTEVAAQALITQLRSRGTGVAADDQRLVQALRSGRSQQYLVYAPGNDGLEFLLPEGSSDRLPDFIALHAEHDRALLGVAKRAASRILLQIAFRKYVLESPRRVAAQARHPGGGRKDERPNVLLAEGIDSSSHDEPRRRFGTEDLRVLVDLSARGGVLLRPLPDLVSEKPGWLQLRAHERYAIETILGFHVDGTIHDSALRAVRELQTRRRLHAIVCPDVALGGMPADPGVSDRTLRRNIELA